jgi:hypothetical protein
MALKTAMEGKKLYNKFLKVLVNILPSNILNYK